MALLSSSNSTISSNTPRCGVMYCSKSENFIGWLGLCYCPVVFAKVASVHNRHPIAPPMLKRLRQFSALNAKDRSIFVKAWFMLGWMRAAILLTSFRRLTRSLEHHPQLRPGTELSEQQLVRAGRIGKLVAVAARYTPWQSLCLVQVLVVQRLLAQHKIPGQFYLGVRRGAEVDADPDGLAAHAWLQCGEAIVNGAAGHELFTVVSVFSWDTGQ